MMIILGQEQENSLQKVISEHGLEYRNGDEQIISV